MRAVDVRGGDGERAMAEMKEAGAEIIKSDQSQNVGLSPEEIDEQIKLFLPDVDRSLIRENLRLSVAERFENLMSLQRFAADLRGGMKKALRR